MGKRYVRPSLRVWLSTAGLWFWALQSIAHDISSTQLPDWSGTWEVKHGPDSGYSVLPTLTAEGRRQVEDYLLQKERGELPESSVGIDCVPMGMPDTIAGPMFLLEFYFTPSKIVAYHEAYGMVRWIHTDGRTMPEDAIPSYMGYSIGHWEEPSSGDRPVDDEELSSVDAQTLVVETGNIYHGTRMSIPVKGQDERIPVQHSEQLHLRERIRLIDENTLEIETTVIDPVIFSKPGVKRYNYKRHREREWEVSEFVCVQNNRAYLDEDGKQHSILTTD